jgi:hypothetical protein
MGLYRLRQSACCGRAALATLTCALSCCCRRSVMILVPCCCRCQHAGPTKCGWAQFWKFCSCCAPPSSFVVAAVVDVADVVVFDVILLVVVLVVVLVIVLVIVLDALLVPQPTDASVNAGSHHWLDGGHWRPRRASFWLYFCPVKQHLYPLTPPVWCRMLSNKSRGGD